jgi:hypothetical protein
MGKNAKYNDSKLLSLIKNYLPSGSEDWKRIAMEYQNVTKEDKLRDYSDVKRYFIEKLCNKNKKGTAH